MHMCLFYDTEANRRGVLYQPTTENRETPRRERNNRRDQPSAHAGNKPGKTCYFQGDGKVAYIWPHLPAPMPGVWFSPIQLLAFRGYPHVTMLYYAYNY